MRDPERIDTICDMLKAEWHKTPDQRFGQFISNLMGEYCAQTGCRDIWFPEDDTYIKFFQKLSGAN